MVHKYSKSSFYISEEGRRKISGWYNLDLFKLHDVKIDQINNKECIKAKVKTFFDEFEVVEFINRNLVAVGTVDRSDKSNIKKHSQLQKIFGVYIFVYFTLNDLYDALDKEIRRIELPF